jgi:hypothetical protein
VPAQPMRHILPPAHPGEGSGTGVRRHRAQDSHHFIEPGQLRAPLYPIIRGLSYVAPTEGVFPFGGELALRQAQGERKSLSVRPELVEGQLSPNLKLTHRLSRVVVGLCTLCTSIGHWASRARACMLRQPTRTPGIDVHGSPAFGPGALGTVRRERQSGVVCHWRSCHVQFIPVP